ncbi:energy-coupling factor ABC transporter ATP-binding protein [Mycobacterium avium subsp. paratuberculosis]|uniref:ABC transporter ATP-binding protein n=1 Tax=Mycobacterium avium TaxID=1764 RepID=UPI001E6436E8|nr:energy-coupling factor ABC transporter ATP-binding protein [Mycobacterium avium]WAI54284.1 energy-coupling factor ABC transporter ATP-binding protein [Mycobacterium avium subsp. paratuberculosis]
MAGETVIRIDGVRWQYAGADAAVLDGVDLHIRRGETVLLCGASGSGKSSVLRLMNGLIPHFHQGSLDGSVHIDGTSVAELSLERVGRLTGTVLQHPRRQFFTAAVDTELAFTLENFGTPPEQIRNRVGSVITEYGLAELTGHRLAELSGGQQQQIACAAAATHGPPLLLFDEPTANLAADAIEGFTATLARLRSLGTTIVIAEHRLHYLREIADRIVLLRNGRIAAEWSRKQFARLDDAALNAEGLRSNNSPVRNHIPPACAYGASVAGTPSGTAAPASSPSEVVLRGIRCCFRGHRVLDIEEARFPAATVTAITGPNGAGKSTLARVLVGLQRHDGEVSFGGSRISRSRRQRMSAIVMQDVQRQLFTESVRAELRLGAPPAAAGVASTLLRDLGLEEFADRHPLSLSGGQQQRLVVAAARLSNRKIMVFDEPSSGVDRRHLRSITNVMRDVAAQGVVVILISHDQELLTLAADQELRMRVADTLNARSRRKAAGENACLETLSD